MQQPTKAASYLKAAKHREEVGNARTKTGVLCKTPLEASRTSWVQDPHYSNQEAAVRLVNPARLAVSTLRGNLPRKIGGSPDPCIFHWPFQPREDGRRHPFPSSGPLEGTVKT